MDESEKAVRMGLKQGLKNIVKDLSCHIGVPRFLLRRYRSNGKPVLLIFRYHRVSASIEGREYMGMSSDMFEQQMIFIKDNFKAVAMTEGLKVISGGDSHGIYAAINFDDGYMDNYLYAFPVLKKYNVPATIFLTTDAIGKRYAFWWDRIYGMMAEKGVDRESAADVLNEKLVEKKEKEIMGFIESMKKGQAGIDQIGECQMLGWPEIKEMGNHNITFGGHTKTHKNLCLLGDDEARAELAESKAMIEKNTGVKAREFSYPFGKFNERIRSLVIESGYECARSSLKGVNDRDTDRYSLTSIDTGSITRPGYLEMRIASILLKRRP